MTRRGQDRPRASSGGLLASTRIRVAAIAAALVVVAAAAFGGWYLFLRSSGPPPVDIGSLPLASASAAGASPAVQRSAGGSPAAAPTAGASTGASAATGAGLDGAWKVDGSVGTGDTGSFVGYRVQEQLAGIGANTAVGRTSAVTGTFTLRGTTIADATFTADLTGLRSDDQRRDGQLRNRGLETATYPTATFTLSQPIDLGSIPADGVVVSVQATGQLTLHGRSRAVQIPLQARRSGNVIAVTGTLPITFGDFAIQPPTSFAVLSIADQGTMELQLLFTRG